MSGLLRSSAFSQAEHAGLLRSPANKSFPVLAQMLQGEPLGRGDLSYMYQCLVRIKDPTCVDERKKTEEKGAEGQR